MHRRRKDSSQTLDRRCSRIVVELVSGCGPRAGHQLLIRPSYRALERHDWSRLSLMAHLSLVRMHRRGLGSSQTLNRRCSRIVVELVSGCGSMSGHQLLIRPSYRALERHDWSRLSLMAHLSLVHMHRRRLGSSQTLDRRRSRIVVACVPGCGPRASHQLLINPSYRCLLYTSPSPRD